MQPTEIICFGTLMFFSLTALLKWKRRRDMVAARLNRGLRGYVEGAMPISADEKARPESMIPAA